MTNGEYFKAQADALGMPLRTLEQVRDKARSKKGERIDLDMTRLMLKHGRLTAEARAYVEAYT